MEPASPGPHVALMLTSPGPYVALMLTSPGPHASIAWQDVLSPYALECLRVDATALVRGLAKIQP